jgi:hypothetical protein
MTLIFNIEYRTSWGEEVRVLGSIPELGNNQPNKATPLHTVDGIHWTAEVDIQIPCNGNVIQLPHLSRWQNHTDRVEQPAAHPARCRQSEESLPHRRLLEESARAAVFLYIRFHRIPAGASRTQCRPEKLQKGVADKGVRPLHRQ